MLTSNGDKSEVPWAAFNSAGESLTATGLIAGESEPWEIVSPPVQVHPSGLVRGRGFPARLVRCQSREVALLYHHHRGSAWVIS